MPDERAVMTYVSSYYHCFAGAKKVIASSDHRPYGFYITFTDRETLH